MKRKKNIHSGICITDDRIVGVTAHIENQTMVITDALEMKRKGTIDEDIIKFIDNYDVYGCAYSIVADIDTQMHLAPYDPHDFDIKEFVKWNVEDYFNFDGRPFQMDACRREYPRHHYHMFMVAVDRHALELLKQGIHDTYANVDVIDFWPIPICYSFMKRNGTVTGIVKGGSLHLWLWWNDICIQESIVPITEVDIRDAMKKLESHLQDYGIDAIQGIHVYGLDELIEEERSDIESVISIYGAMEYMPLVFLGRGRTRCTLGKIEWDMAIGMAARGLKWIGLGW